MYNIYLDGIKIAVSKDVYEAFYQEWRRERYYAYDIKHGSTYNDTENDITIYTPPKEVSLEALSDQGIFFQDPSDVEEEVLNKIMVECLKEALKKLTDEELSLIHALFYEGLSVAETARRKGVSRKTIRKRRGKILAKLKNCSDFAISGEPALLGGFSVYKRVRVSKWYCYRKRNIL